MMLREPWRTRLLFLSFALNLVLIPIAAERWWRTHPPLTPGLPRAEMMVEHMVKDLPPGDVERFRATMDAHVAEIETARLRMLAARGAMSRDIGRTPFDAPRVKASMQNWQTAWTEWSDALGAAMLDSLPGLSEEGRQRLAASGQRRPPR